MRVVPAVCRLSLNRALLRIQGGFLFFPGVRLCCRRTMYSARRMWVSFYKNKSKSNFTNGSRIGFIFRLCDRSWVSVSMYC